MSDTILITKDEFNKAVMQATADLMNDERLKGEAQFIISAVGMMFSSNIRKYLFEEEE